MMRSGWRFHAAWLIAFALACGKKPAEITKDGGTTQTQTETLALVSYPLTKALSGAPWSYRALLSKPGESTWTLTEAPTGAEVSSSGLVRWTPSTAQAGDNRFVVKGTLKGESATQTFTVTVTALEVQKEAKIDPSNPNGGSLSVDAPLSNIKGSGIVIPPNAVGGKEVVQFSISEVKNAPLPLAAQLSQLSATDLKPVEFGPSGMAFQNPVTITLPLSQALLAKGGDVQVQTYDFASGQWESVKVLSVDREAGVVAAEVHHFSIYVGSVEKKVFTLDASTGGAACTRAVFARAPMSLALTDINRQYINGYGGTAANAKEALTQLLEGEGLQVVIQLDARSIATGSGQVISLMGSAVKLASGAFKVAVTSSVSSGSLLNIPDAVALADVESWLNGSRIQGVMGGLDISQGVDVGATASLYFLPKGADPLRIPPVLSSTVGPQERVKIATLAPTTVADTDCDGAPDAFDATASGTPPPTLAALPASPLRAVAGSMLTLSVQTDAAATLTWAANDPAATLNLSTDKRSASIAVPSTNALRVTVTADANGARAQYNWDVFIDSATAPNTRPIVKIGAAPSNIVRANDRVTLSAIAFDAEQPASSLTYTWKGPLATRSFLPHGAWAEFVATEPGDYTIYCTASDGALSSVEAAVTISVLAGSVNRPPPPPVVTPLSVTLEHSAGQLVSQVLKANSVDPDGDAVTYRFIASPMNPPGSTLTVKPDSATFQTTSDGTSLVYVIAVDSQGAESPWTIAKIQVTPPLTSTVDNDKDGFPQSADCDDKNPNVFPGATEICGDQIDQDCNGADLSLALCDADKDRYTITDGDCDDQNPARNPGAIERCDGVDNNCNAKVDEGFGIGAQCTTGVGACRADGIQACSATGAAVVCSAQVGAPKPETCNLVDDDCDGRVDNVPSASANDVNNCGGCGVVCSSRTNSNAACSNGGCSYECQAGYFDADRNLANGCECAPNAATGGKEVCNGIDDNCDGVIDEGTNQTYYDGPIQTLNVGQCVAGLKVCQSGQLVIARPALTPKQEICDGLDNDCEGRVDQNWSFNTDAANCGACGVICGANSSCVNGVCSGTVKPDAGTADGGADGGTATCQAPRVECGTPQAPNCTDLNYDYFNCGACGHACSAGSTCNNGVCATGPSPSDGGGPVGSDGGAQVCAPMMLNCGTSQQPYCVDPRNDIKNCGDCGRMCTSGQTCSNGVCTSTSQTDGGTMTCASPMISCGPQGMQSCVDPRYDNANCGMCGRVCNVGTSCYYGQCMTPTDGGPVGGGDGGTMSCQPPMVTCGTTQMPYCTDLKYDNNNCGSCGYMCSAGTSCNNGTCMPPPDGGQTGGGDAGTISCSPPTIACGSPQAQYCTDPRYDNANCGGCGRLCEVGMTCTNGTCMPPPPDGGQTGGTDGGMSCPYPMVTCGTTQMPYCTDLKYDNNNCGSCGYMCSAGTSCNNGTCMPPPDGGQTGGSDGGMSCPAPMSVCGTPQMPYCTDLKYDNNNCGSCGYMCSAGTSCNNGTCMPPPDGGQTGGTDGGMSCPSPMSVCGTPQMPICTDTRYDSSNCGQCGVVCSAGTSCVNSICTAQSDGGQTGGPDGGASCPQPLLNCGTPQMPMCTDPRYDNSNCGACGQVCTTGMTCNNGACMPQSTDGGQTGGTDGGGTQCQPGATQSCYGGPPGTLNVGTCTSGTRTCMPNGTWDQFCAGEMLPKPEMCGNGADDNCNGQTDEGCPLSIVPTAGVQLLVGSSFTFQANGGTPPYVWSISSASPKGSINPQGQYTAGSSAGTDVIRVTDANNTFAEASASTVTTVGITFTPPGGTFNMPKINVELVSVVGATFTASLNDAGIIVQNSGPGRGMVMIDAPTDGVQTLNATASFSNQTAAGSATYVIDRQPPSSPSITSPSQGATVQGPNVVVAGTGENGALIDLFEVNAGPPIGTGVVTDGGFVISISNLVTGDHSVTARATDLAGNMSTNSASRDFLLLNGQPAPLSANPTSTSVPVNGNVKLRGRGGTPPYVWSMVTNVSGGSITPSGNYTAGNMPGNDVVKITDSAPMPAQVNVTVTVNPPLTCTVISPQAGANIVGPQLSFTVSTSPNANVDVMLDGKPYPGLIASPQGMAQGMMPLPTTGPHMLSATCSLSGQQASAPGVNFTSSP